MRAFLPFRGSLLQAFRALRCIVPLVALVAAACSGDLATDRLDPDGGSTVGEADAGAAHRRDAGPSERCCDDGVACTRDICEADCRNEPDPTRCPEVACVAYACDRTAGCVVSQLDPTACDDGNPCTADTCTEKGCAHTSIEGACDDGLFCNGSSDRCVNGACAGDASATPVCGGATPQCDEAGRRCVACLADADCGSGRECCAGACVSPGCEDGNPCTTNACGASGCLTSPLTGTACDDGVFCNGTDSCSNGSCAQHTGSPCGGSTPSCDEGAKRCVACLSAADCPAPTSTTTACDYPNFCATQATRTTTTTSYACIDNQCVAQPRSQTVACAGRPAPNCDDGNACTVDRCLVNGCVSSPAANGTPCDDLQFCNGADACLNGQCTQHSGNPCTPVGLVCSPSLGCAQCLSNADCPAPRVTSSACRPYTNECDLEQDRTETTTTYACVSNTCVAQTSSRITSAGCPSRNTEFLPCSVAAWGPCTCGACYRPRPNALLNKECQQLAYRCRSAVCTESVSRTVSICGGPPNCGLQPR